MSEELIGCGSHSCIIKPPEGMGNNGPCRCADWRGQRYIQQLTARAEQAEAMRDRLIGRTGKLTGQVDTLLREQQEDRAALRDTWRWIYRMEANFQEFYARHPEHRKAIERIKGE